MPVLVVIPRSFQARQFVAHRLSRYRQAVAASLVGAFDQRSAAATHDLQVRWNLMVGTDPHANDPFFRKGFDTNWNALIGRQGREENYLDGYIQAAITLAEVVIEQALYRKRDTLVLPILFNARHAVELTLKFATDRLAKAKLIRKEGHRRNHNIKGYWDLLFDSEIGDETLLQTIIALKPFVISLSQIDSDGQELRYHRNRDDQPSLLKYSLANLKLIRTSLYELMKLLSVLTNRTIEFLEERKTGSYTNRCSRSDLLAIARLLPSRVDWGTVEFDQQKEIVKERFQLGNRQFSIALERIQANREMRAILGMESQLVHLTDDEIVLAVEQWRCLHSVREPSDKSHSLHYFASVRFAAMMDENVVRQEVASTILSKLSRDDLADLETIFYLGRDDEYTEYYEASVARTYKEHAASNDPQVEIFHLMDKMNFFDALQVAVHRLGRLSLAERLKDMGTKWLA